MMRSKRDYRQRFLSGEGGATHFNQHLMDACVHCLHKALSPVMWSSSVDNYVMDVKRWVWCQNGFIGDYVVRVKDAKEEWHKFSKIRKGTKRRHLMWVQNNGQLVVLEGDRAGTWVVYHPEAENCKVVKAEKVEEVFERVKSAKVNKELVF